MYFVEIVAIEERRKERQPSMRIPLFVPNYTRLEVQTILILKGAFEF
jgi:hypothetical protein